MITFGPRAPKPIERWVVVNVSDGARVNRWCDTQRDADAYCEGLTDPSKYRVVPMRKIDPDTVAVPRAVVQEILNWRTSLSRAYVPALDALADAVKGGA